MITVIIVIVKSWKYTSSSIIGEALSWKDNIDHVGISKELFSYK